MIEELTYSIAEGGSMTIKEDDEHAGSGDGAISNVRIVEFLDYGL